MKKIVILFIVLCICLIQTTVFGLDISNSSNAGDKVSIFGDLKTDKDMHGDAVVIRGNADIENNVNGDVVVIFGDVVINAKVTGDVVAVFGKITLTEKAKVGGDLVTIWGKATLAGKSEVGGDLVSLGSIDRAEGSIIKGQDTIIDLGNIKIGDYTLDIAVIIFLGALVFFVFFVIVLGVPIVIIWNKKIANISLNIEKDLGKKFATGILGFIICLVTMIILGITVLVPLAYFLLAILIEIVVSIFIGKVVLKLLNSDASVYVQFFLGLFLLELAKVILILLIPANGLPGGIALYCAFNVMVNALGVGILIDSKFTKKTS